MALVADIKKTVTEATPVYAAVGVTDLAVEKVRDARIQAVAARKALAPAELTAQAEKAAKQVQEAPAVLFNRGIVLAGKAQQQYEDLAVRGEKLVQRIRNQKATQDLLHQVDQTVSVGKGAVTTVRHAVAETERSARATLTTGRREAAKATDAVVDTIQRDARATSATVRESAKATRTAAKRTATTARKGAAASTSRVKATTTTARKTTPRARKATSAAATKVGD